MTYVLHNPGCVAEATTELGSEAEEGTAGCLQPWGIGRGLAVCGRELCRLARRSVCISQSRVP